MLQNAPADPLAALEEKYRSKMLQQQHAAAIGSKETTKRSRRIWSFFGEGQGSGKQSFVGYFVSLSAFKLPSGQKDTKSEVVGVAGGFASDVHTRYLWRRCWIRLWLAGFLVLTCLILLYLFAAWIQMISVRKAAQLASSDSFSTSWGHQYAGSLEGADMSQEKSAEPSWWLKLVTFCCRWARRVAVSWWRCGDSALSTRRLIPPMRYNDDDVVVPEV